MHFACELKDFDPTTWIDRKQARRMDRFSQLALSAARMAEADSGISIAAEPDRVGAAVATGIGGLDAFEDCFQSPARAWARSDEPVRDRPDHPEHGRRVGVDGARRAGPARRRVHRLRGLEHGDRRRARRDPARPRGRHVLRRHRGAGHARRHRRLQRDARALAAERRPEARRRGRSTPTATASSWARPARCSCSRSSSTRARAARRSTREVLGYGVSSDATHVTEPDPTRRESGARDEDGVRRRRDRARRGRATSTRTARRRRSATRPRRACSSSRSARRRRTATPVSSTKGATGHCLGAAGAVEAIFTIFALQRGVLPPTINYETPDPECDLDYIPNEARRQEIEIGVSNSFGFGGHNACVVFRRWDESA